VSANRSIHVCRIGGLLVGSLLPLPLFAEERGEDPSAGSLKERVDAILKSLPSEESNSTPLLDDLQPARFPVPDPEVPRIENEPAAGSSSTRQKEPLRKGPPTSSPHSQPAPVDPETLLGPIDQRALGDSFSPLANPSDWTAPPPSPADATRRSEARPEPSPLYRVAQKVVKEVLLLRVYDEFGLEISSGAGAFVNRSGAILADASLVPPELADQAAYITAINGLETPYRVSGVWKRHPERGTLLLQADVDESAPLEIHELEPLPDGETTPVAVVAFSRERGLLLADATLEAEREDTGAPWFRVTGQDSPAAVGSPILDLEGRIVAFAAMSLPLEQWVTFAAPVDHLETLDRDVAGSPRAVSHLASVRSDEIEEDPRLRSAYASIREKRYAAAARTLLELSREHPRATEVWALLGMASFHLGAKESSVRYYQRAAALQPEAGSVWLQLALAERALRRQAPEEALEKAVQTRPDSPTAWLLLAQEQIRASEFAAADESLAQLTKLRPDDADGFLLRGYVKSKLDEIAAAETALKRSLQLDSKNPRAWFLLGLVLSERNQHREAARAYKKVVRFEEHHPHAWMNLAQSYLKTGNRTEARIAFERHREILAARNVTP